MTHFPETFPVPLIRLAETDSTSLYLRNRCHGQELKEGTTVTADFQTSGRGQRGNSWESEKGRNLLFSFVLYPSFLEARRQFLLSQMTSLAIKEELDTYAEGFSVKWPNDIYWQNQKICGILIENELMGSTISQSIAGIGINLNQDVFHSPAPNPVSLKQITGETYDPVAVLGKVMQRVREYYSQLQKEETASITARYQDALFRKEGMYRYKDATGTFLARIVEVEPSGQLILQDEAGEKRRYVFKEVQYIL